MSEEKITFLRRVRSFVRRDGRMTDAQKQALEKMWPHVGLELANGLVDFAQVFQRAAPTILEIGFGSGFSLLEMAKANPEQNFIGIETHLPGIGTLLQGIDENKLQNIRVYYADAVEVFAQCIPAHSLDVIQIFFPDPWPKRRHRKRRLIQPQFIEMILPKLKSGGAIHLATDWQDYAEQMMQVLSAFPQLVNTAGVGQYADRSSQRPVITKFEQRGKNDGREIWELQFASLCSFQ